MSILTRCGAIGSGMGRPTRTDVVAGLTASAVVLPKAMAYATVAGLPVAVGLYTAFVPMLIYALLGTLQGIVVAIIISLLGLASQTAHPTVYVIGRKPGADVLRPLSPEHPEDEQIPGLLLLRPEGRLFFVNAQYVAEQIRALIKVHQPKVLALDMSRVPDIEYSALQMLMAGDKRSVEQGVEFWLVGLNPKVLEAVRHSGLAARMGEDRLLFNARAAIAHYQQRAMAG